jgi:acetolactate synthase-1/2/3 large subunit
MDYTQITSNANRTVAEAYLAHLRKRGIEYLYMGAGTDTAPLVEAYAATEDPACYPKPIVTSHENLAVGMAHGYYMATGKPQAVMLHVTVGAANAICALMNARRSQIPIFFTAGRTPLFEEGCLGARNSPIHWAQEMYDQAGMARELVKWDYELRDGRNVQQIVDRALDIAMAEPKGPIYLTLPREVLARPVSQSPDCVGPAQEPIRARLCADPQQIELLAQRIRSSQYPVIVTSSSGINPATVSLLAELAEQFSFGVAESMPHYVNFPTPHPLYLGTNSSVALRESDLVIALDCDVPWIPEQGGPPPEAFIAHIAIDPLFSDIPVRSFRADLLMSSDIQLFLVQLKAALIRANAQDTAQDRYRRITANAGKFRDAIDLNAQNDADRGGPITKVYLSRCLDEIKPADAVLINEYSLIKEHMKLTEGGTYFLNSTAGGLGWAFPAALGVKQAQPDKTVIAIHGDGSYIFCNPAACHHASQMHALPILVLVYNNSHWQAVEKSTLAIYPDGATRRRVNEGKKSPLSCLEPVPAFEEYAKASGGYGERVTERTQLIPAIKRALHAVQQEKRHALLNIIGS